MGCFRVELQPWRPVIRLGNDTVYTTPPIRVEIRGDRVTDGLDRRGYLVRPAPGVVKSVHTFAHVQARKDSVFLVWSNGFSGVTMALEARVDTLTGQAESFWDFDRQRQRAPARLVRVQCQRGLTPRCC